MNSRFPTIVENALRGAGWYPLRRESLAHFMNAITADQHELNAAASAFLQEFGGLHVPYTVAVPNFGELKNVFRVAPRGSEGLIRQEDTRLTGTPVCPIGDVDSGHVGVAMAPDGRVFAIQEETVCLLGSP